MTRYKTWTLTDVHGDVWLDSFAAGNDSLRLPTPHDWSIRKRTLRGGLRDGVDLIEVHNGALSFSRAADARHGPVARRLPRPRPRLALARRGARSIPSTSARPTAAASAGWPASTNCCAAAAWPPTARPARTPGPTRTAATPQPLTLHGRIANLPAQAVEVRVNLDPPYELSVTGEVEEAALFFPQLRLTTTYTTVPGSNRLVIHDVVENRSAQPAEMQMLYHCNLGPPFLEAGSRVLAPIREMAPHDAAGRRGHRHLRDLRRRPRSASPSRSTLYDLLADARGQTLALLVNAAADRAVCLRFNRRELPCFTVWKNTGGAGGRLRHRPGAGDELSELQDLRAPAAAGARAAAGRPLGGPPEHRGPRHPRRRHRRAGRDRPGPGP